MDELVQCRQAELEFVSSAYMEDEVWWEYEDEKNAIPRIFRRLEKQVNGDDGDDDGTDGGARFSLVLELLMTPNYPLEAPLEVNGKVDEVKTDKKLLKQTYDVLPSLISCCRETAESMLGTEAVFSVLSAADDFINDLIDSEAFLQKPVNTGEQSDDSNCNTNKSATKLPVLLGRRLIYSHHIISSKKRADLKRLFAEYNLTGYVKIGWPGLIIIEGNEEACLLFYDVIRRWAWQYLVVRGEMQEEIEDGSDLESRRRFSEYIEVQDMSIVAGHCREVGLEALFRTSMKQYGTDDERNDCNEQEEDLYGALVHVDHFNDAKSYRKWLSKTSNQLGVGFLVKECYHSQGPENTNGEDCTVTCNGRPLIVVALIGDSTSVSSMLKKWRTTRVDVDSKGKPCLERRMTVLAEQRLERKRSIDRLDWDSLASNDQKAVSKQQLIPIIESIGGETWVKAMEDLFSLS